LKVIDYHEKVNLGSLFIRLASKFMGLGKRKPFSAAVTAFHGIGAGAAIADVHFAISDVENRPLALRFAKA
jgi:hypothetical protein